MRDLAILLIHLIATLVKLLGRGGARSVVAESVLLKHQLLVLNRSRKRAPKLRPMDRIVAGLCATSISPLRLVRSAIVLKPSTILGFHQQLVKRKYRLLFTPKRGRRPGPKGPSPELIAAIVGMKHRNPRFGCRHIAQQLSYIFGIDVDKNVVRRVLAAHYRPKPGSQGPSWLSFLGHTKASLWSVDLFRCESLILKSHWVMVVMDQFTRRIIGFAAHAGNVDGPAVCRMFNEIIAGQDVLPSHLSSDHDPLFEFRQWSANLRILDVTELKTVPYVPLSHPFIERLIGTIRRELLDHVLYWTASDLERKLRRFQSYYNRHRIHFSLAGVTPDSKAGNPTPPVASLSDYRWRSHCRDLYQLPAAA
jgi:transposase InsO family protein